MVSKDVMTSDFGQHVRETCAGRLELGAFRVFSCGFPPGLCVRPEHGEPRAAEKQEEHSRENAAEIAPK